MHARVVALAVLVAACEPPVTENSSQGVHYDPGEPNLSTCKCMNIHGTCNADCSITCDSGYADCDIDVSNGCEAALSDPGTCGTCDNDCGECNDSPSCVAGQCAGKPLPNGAACHMKKTCGTSGMCVSGSCVCAAGVDLAGLPPAFHAPPDMAHGHDLPGDCSFTGGGTATATLVLLTAVVLLLNRRRRSE
jgi:uncharacterized protein (TIGR03382 family)